MINKNPLPSVLSLIGLYLGVAFFTMSAQAQSLNILDPSIENDFSRPFTIRTTTITPLMLSFFKAQDSNEIQGEVFFLAQGKADRLVLEAFDAGGAKFYTQEYSVNLEEKKSQKFRFQAPSYGLSAGSKMEVRLFNQEVQVGREEKTLPKVEAQVNYRISNIDSRLEESLVSVNLSFENGSLNPVSIQPQIKVSEQSSKPEKIVLRDFFEPMEVEGKSRAELDYSFGRPDKPGLYRVEVVALSDKKRVLSGTLESFFVVPGDFAVFDGVYVENIPPTDNEPVVIKFVGDYEGSEDQLQLELEADLIDTRGKLVGRISQMGRPYVDRGSFSQSFHLDGPLTGLSEVKVRGLLRSSAGVGLAELKESFQLSEVKAGTLISETLVEDEGGEDKLWSDWRWYHWAGLGLALLVLMLLLTMLKRSHRRTTQFVLWLVLSAFGTFQTASAALEVFWHHPVTGWYYNANATGDFAEFSVMKMQGNIFNTLTQKGFFYQVPERIVVSFFKDLTYDEDGVRICTDCFYLEPSIASTDPSITCVNEDNYVGPDAEICDHKTYRFELDLPIAIEEGQWGAQILFKLDGVWYGTNWYDEAGSEWYRINFDSTSPALTGALTYNNNPAPLSGQLVYEAKQPIEDGPTGLESLHQSIASDKSGLELAKNDRDLLIHIAKQKLEARNHKIAVDVYNREQAILNGAPNGTQLQTEIDNIATAINALTHKFPGNPSSFNPNNPGPKASWDTLGINDISRILGEFTPPGQVVPLNILDSNYGIAALIVAPPSNDQATSPYNTQISTFGSQISTNQSQVELLKTQLRSVNQIHEKDAVELGMACADPELETGVDGAGCNAVSLVANVRGNFCEVNEVCEDNSINTYEVCDQVGNCAYSTNVTARMDWYDPVAPTADDIDIVKFKNDVGGTETTITGDSGDKDFAAGDRVSVEIKAPGDVAAFDPVADYSTHPTLFDQNACGSGVSDFYYDTVPDPANTFCSQSVVRCPLSSSKRGTQDLSQGGSCVGDCPPGFALQGNLCVPFCDFRLFDGCFPFLLIGDQCTVTTWLPDPATVPFGDPFTQVNNCGETRQSVGTKSITGTLNHFLDGKEVFGAYIYDTTEDSLPSNYILNVDIDGGGTGGFSPYTSIQDFADMTVEDVNSPSAGRAFKVNTFDVAGANRYGSWQRTAIPVSQNTDYVLSYWVKTDATVNKNEEGAWVAITGNGSTTDIWQQYAATMEGVAGNLNWYKVIIPFTTPASTTEIDISLRVQQQNSKTAYFDDIRIFSENWRFDSSQSWYSETLDDLDGDCDYIQTSGGVTIDGPDDRCGEERFPEKAVLVYTSDGFYIFDAEKGSFWMKAVQDSNSSVFGRFVFNALMSGQTFGLDGNLYLAHRFNEPNSSYDDRNGAVEVMDLLADEMYTHRMSGCYTLAGVKGTGTSYTTNGSCENNGYRDWNGFVNDSISQRNVTRTYWSNEMPAGQQIATHQINQTSAGVFSSKTYVAVATDYGVSVLNKTDDTVKHLEWDGYNGDNYTWDYLHPDGSTYHQALLEPDGALWYKWNWRRSSDDGSRIWKLNDVTSLTYNNGVTSGNDTSDSWIQPMGYSGAYPTTAQDEDSTAFDVQNNEVLSGGDIGLERFYGTLVGGDASQHPDLAKMTVNKNYATSPLYGKTLGHWVNSTDDIGDYDNDLTNQGSVTTSAVASGADLTQFDLNGSSQYLSSGSSDFNVNGAGITFGAWVKTTGTEDGGYIMSKGNDSVLDFAVYRKSDNTLRVTGTADTDIAGYTLGQTANDWDHVAVSFDGTSKKTYLNGTLISNVADTKTQFDGSGGSSTLTGRYVRVEQTNNYLHMAEVQVFDDTNSTNLALAGTATQIDDYGGYAVASRAIDNNTNGAWSGSSVTHTASSSGTIWWEVDLGAEYDLGDIVIWNRTDCCSSRLSSAVVSVLDTSRNTVAASSPLTGSTTQTLNLAPSNLPDTRYVRVEKTTSGTYPYLYLAEVQVFDAGSTNLATSGTASSYSPYTSASRAIDGSTNGEWYNSSVFRTNYSTGTNVWWEVDLGSEQSINEVTIWNRTDSRWDYLIGSVVKLLDGSRNTVGTSEALSNNTTQNPTFTGVSSSSFYIGTHPVNPTQSSNLLSGAVALPFFSEGAYEPAQITDIYDKTLNWLNADAKVTLQGTSNDVLDVVFGDDGDYFVVTSYGITHFDANGVMIRTMTTDANSSTNTQIISTDINDIDYKNRYLILAYKDPDGNGAQQARGLEIITIGTEPND